MRKQAIRCRRIWHRATRCLDEWKRTGKFDFLSISDNLYLLFIYSLFTFSLFGIHFISLQIQVAIKCLCRERMQSNPMEFLKEAAIMHSIEHENIVRLYGVVLDTDSLMLVTELAHLRSLLECLKDSGLRVSFLTVPTLCEFAQQICSGMMYLENKRLIHR